MRHEDIPEINMPKIRFPVLEGDKLMKEVLNGGYNVHPVQNNAQPTCDNETVIISRLQLSIFIAIFSLGC